jgi:hypothetical protein
VSFFFFWYLGYLVFRLAVMLKESMPAIVQPFPYFALSLGSLLMFGVTLILEERTFRPPFTVSLYGSANPDFSLLSYTAALVIFEISVFLYAFTLFYGLGEEAIVLSHADLIGLRRKKMKPYYESILLDGAPTCMGKNSSSALVWIGLYGINVSFIIVGFYKYAWITIVSGLYGIYETTWEFAKLYPNWFERKIIILSYGIAFFANFFLNFTPDYISYKLYPVTVYSQYFFLVLHYIFKLIALVMLLFIANLDQHTPFVQSNNQNVRESDYSKD